MCALKNQNLNTQCTLLFIFLLKPVDRAHIAFLCSSTLFEVWVWQSLVFQKINVFGNEELYYFFLHVRCYSKSNSPKSHNPIDPPQFTLSGSINGVCETFWLFFLGKHKRELYSSGMCPFLYINITHVFSPIRISVQKPAPLFFPKSHTGGSLGKKTKKNMWFC